MSSDFMPIHLAPVKDHMSYSIEAKRNLRGRPERKVKSIDIQEKLLPEPEQKQRHRQGRESRASNRHNQLKGDPDKRMREGLTVTLGFLF